MEGEYGEAFVNVGLSQWTAKGRVFRTVLIGGKWPNIDIYAETENIRGETCIAVFQVKNHREANYIS